MGEVRIKSGNLFDVKHFVDTAYCHNVVLTQLDNGIKIQATSSNDPYANYVNGVIGQTLPTGMRSAVIPCKPNTDYTLHCVQSSRLGKYISYFDKDYKVVKNYTPFSGTPLSFKTPETCVFILLRLGDRSTLSEGTTIELTNIQILEGTYTTSTIPEYQPYFFNRPAHKFTNGEWIDIPTHHYTNNRWQGELTSQSPLKFRADGAMLDWRVEGKTSENLWDGTIYNLSPASYPQFAIDENGYMYSTPTSPDYREWTYQYSQIRTTLSAGTYTFAITGIAPTLNGAGCNIRKSDDTSLSGINDLRNRNTWVANFTLTETTDIGVVAEILDGKYHVQILKGTYTSSTIPPYEPYGGVGDWDETTQRYKIPVTVNGTTTNLYTDHQLMDGDSIDYATDQTTIPLAVGNNTLTVDTAVQPKSVFVKFEG